MNKKHPLYSYTGTTLTNGRDNIRDLHHAKLLDKHCKRYVAATLKAWRTYERIVSGKQWKWKDEYRE